MIASPSRWDHLKNVDIRQAREAAVRVVDAVQDLEEEEQLAGMAVLFLLVAERYDLEPRRALEVAGNVIHQAKLFNAAHLEGLRMYLREKL